MDTKDFLKTDRDEIRKLWGKSKEEVSKDIKILKEWIETQKHLPEIPSDNMLEYILFGSKFSIEKAKKFVDMYYTARDLLPEFYRNIHPCWPETETAFKTGYSVLVPKVTPSMYRVLWIKYKEGDVDDMDWIKMMACSLRNLHEIRLQEDLVMGDVHVIDLSNFKFAFSLQMTPSLLKKFVFVTQNVHSNRIKQMHLINLPSFMEGFLSILKSFLSKKLKERFYFHQSIETLTKYVPLESIPSDYGGKEKSLEELTDMMRAKYVQYKDRFDTLEAIKINEALRPEKLNNDELLGYYGNFKQLETD